MKRPRVICELSGYLSILLRSGFRFGEENEPGVRLLASPAEIEKEGPAPAFFLELYHVAPDHRALRASSIHEKLEESRDSPRGEVERPPLWVACRYQSGVRGRSREEEQEMIAALLRTLHDHPLLTAEHLPSLRGLGGVNRFPLEIIEEREGWRHLGLVRPRLLISFQVLVPIPSAITEPLQRVFEREIHLEELK